MNIQERLTTFFQRLNAAPPAGSAEEAMNLVCRVIEEVEAEFCPLPRQDPPPTAFSGRMYAPQPDHIWPADGGGLKARTRRHLIHCEADGGITLTRIASGRRVLAKPGKTR